MIPSKAEPMLPLSKSWLMRIGLLDLLSGRYMTIDFLEDQPVLSTDLQALLRASKQWLSGQTIDVGESGTLYRFLKFAAWNSGQDRQFIKHGTLLNRPITDDPSIVNLPLSELLKLDNGTSQWASAAVLLGNKEVPPSPMPFMLDLTYQALEHWQKSKEQNKHWVAKKDQTIRDQANAYFHWAKTNKIIFTPRQAEDYCFARAFGLISPEEGEARWPSLRQHESDRIAEMDVALNQTTVTSADHRVVQAIAMLKGNKVKFKHPEAVAKSWPLFWEVIKLTT